MNKKGFTLVELLVVVILIAAIVLLALPKITNSVKNYSGEVDEITYSIIKDATKLYVGNNANSFMKRSENTYCVSLNELVEEEYLKNKIEYNGQDITDTKVIKVTYNNGFNYELVNKNDCNRVIRINTICDLISGEENNLGSKYECEVKSGTKYNFFVVSYNDAYGNIIADKENAVSLNLVMDRNICEDGTLTDYEKEDKCLVPWNASGLNEDGPVTAMDYLYNATRDWTRIPNIIMNYTDENIDSYGDTGNYGYGMIITIDGSTKITKKDGTLVKVLTDEEGYNNLKVRMLSYKDIGVASAQEYLNDYLNSCREIYESCDEHTNIIPEIYGYWLLPSFSSASNEAWQHNFSGTTGTDEVDVNYSYGVRPVITSDL